MTFIIQYEIEKYFEHLTVINPEMLPREDLKTKFAPFFKTYFAVASKRLARATTKDDMTAINRRIFEMRATLEKKLLEHILIAPELFLDEMFKKGFFGKSKKQGVSVRFPLSSCVPTAVCGHECYAHDGRDKHMNAILRGVFNLATAKSGLHRNECSDLQKSYFLRQVDSAINVAIKEKEEVIASDGYFRGARIRLSHVGEMCSEYDFTNWLAKKISMRSDGLVQPVVYTRHPKAKNLNANAIAINFTLDSECDSRRSYAPKGSRIVASAWDGNLVESAQVNFLEHHSGFFQGNLAMSTESKNVCPVTLNHGDLKSCDDARCEICFTLP